MNEFVLTYLILNLLNFSPEDSHQPRDQVAAGYSRLLQMRAQRSHRYQGEGVLVKCSVFKQNTMLFLGKGDG